jgi:ATP-dependent RNA helicase DeaD
MEKENTGVSFASLGLKESLLNGIVNMGYKNPTPIQSDTIPLILQGRDVLGQAQTGTGKTAAFVLPILNNIDEYSGPSRSPQVLVLTPTRELAIQVMETFESFAKSFASNISAVAIYGGQDYTRQIRALNRGVHIVVGTAGRIMDHMRKETLNLESIKTLVLDEADEMLRMGFIDDVKWILSHTSDSCQRLLFSATIPRDVVSIADSYLRNPVKIHVKSKTTTASTIRQRFLVVKGMSKLDALDRLLSYETTDGVLIFVRTKTETVEVASGLKNFGYNAATMSGDMSQGQRELIIEQFKSGKIKVLVGTDVVARGLDVDCISHVINYELPQDNEAYVHRIGRTGRAGREGDAISLVTMREMRQLQILERSIKQPLEEMYLPSAADITKKRIENFKKEVLKSLEQSGLEKYTSIMHEFKTEYADINLEDLLGALTFMIQKDKPLYVSEVPIAKFEERSHSRTGQKDFGNDRRRESRDPRENRSSRSNDRQSDNRSTPMITYRVEVGSSHGIQVRNIVGAIANESGLDGSSIGQIRIFDDYSTVKLPTDIPTNILQKIKNLRVANIRLDLKEMTR